MPLNKQLSDFELGYELGVKHNTEYNDLLQTINNAQKQTFTNSKKNIKQNKTPQEIQDDEFILFMENLCNNYDKIKVVPNYTGENSIEVNILQKKFIRFYQYKKKTNYNVFPVLKMRAGGMTTILQELAFKEYLAGKKVLYVSPNPDLTRLAKQQFEYKEKISQYVPFQNAILDSIAVNDYNNYQITFQSKIIGQVYNLIIVDELPLTVDITNVLEMLNQTCQCYGNCKAFVAFTPNPHTTMEKNEKIKKILEKYEFEGNLFKYSDLSIEVLKRLKNNLRHFFYNSDEDGDFWTSETITQSLRECLGIL